MSASKVKCYSYMYRQSNNPCTSCPPKQLELEQMKTKVERLERERNDLKQQSDKMENRVSVSEPFSLAKLSIQGFAALRSWWSALGQGTFSSLVLVCLPRDHE